MVERLSSVRDTDMPSSDTAVYCKSTYEQHCEMITRAELTMVSADNWNPYTKAPLEFRY